ncbi:unnamed protein product [Euphydryas editha]|uniref:Reverse transcriptase domain-containing protein n=1 Tax=Euphydryas editha TaxID=104508 RepID=A0AAU9UGL7_EUPED|nr:unnamed protein product [Euphydryas editha]
MIQVERSLKSNRTPRLNFNKSDYQKINKEIATVNWWDRWKDMDVEEMVGDFYTILNLIIEMYTPYSRPHNEKYPNWFTIPLIKCTREKLKFHKKYKKYENAANTIRFQPKKIWSFVKSQKSNNLSIPNQMHLDDRVAAGGQEIADLFSEYFQSVYTLHNNYIAGDCDPVLEESSSSFSKCALTETEILTALKRLDPNKGPGLDGIPNKFLKQCAETLAMPLHILFNKSLTESIFPAIWKQARLTPIHKKGDMSNICNYRPVSILPAIGKVFEGLMQKKIYWHVKEIIHSEQHGFMPKKSTASNLIGFISDIAEALDDGDEVHAVYTDFSKAFDLIDHARLLKKISAVGIHGSLLRWCESYLQRRSQLVMIRGYSSRSKIIPTGVPQGSHMGPLLFVIYINDLAQQLKCLFKMYADDLKIYKCIKTENDVKILQKDLDRVQTWSENNKMKLNIEKCYHIKFTRKKIPITAIYTLQKAHLKEVNEIRDLGVIVDSRLSFISHVDSIVKKASRLSGFISRQTKIFKDPKILIPIYNCLVRSILEYNSPIWSPGYAVHIKRIERVQKRLSLNLH